MANNENLIPIPGRLHSVATEGHVAGADEIYDDNLQKDQATINQEVQEAIGTGGSVDSKIAAAINALDSEKSQTAGSDGLALSVTEVDGKITSISGSIAANTYDANGAAATAKTEVIGGATSSGNTLKKLEDRVSPLETAVGSGGSIDTRISNAVAAETAAREAADTALDGRIDTLEDVVEDCAYIGENDGTAVIADFDPHTDTVWKKAQTLSSADKAQVKTNLGLPQEIYSKTEVNELVSTPHQNYVTVSTYSELPASGSTNTIYRVSNYDGTQVAAGVYSEYAWNGSSYVFLAAKSSVGEVFNISEYHAGAKYADLAAALDSNNGGGVPQSLQKGGMSVKFVSNSDNKYVQYRLMSNSFNTTLANWQGVDTEPTVGSDNLVKSGGVEKAARPINGIIDLDGLTNVDLDSLTKTEGSLGSATPCTWTVDQYNRYHKVIPISDVEEVFIKANNNQLTQFIFLKSYTAPTTSGQSMDIALYPIGSIDSVITVPAGETATVKVPQDANYIVYNTNSNSDDRSPLVVLLKKNNDAQNKICYKVSDFDYEGAIRENGAFVKTATYKSTGYIALAPKGKVKAAGYGGISTYLISVFTETDESGFVSADSVLCNGADVITTAEYQNKSNNVVYIRCTLLIAKFNESFCIVDNTGILIDDSINQHEQVNIDNFSKVSGALSGENPCTWTVDQYNRYHKAIPITDGTTSIEITANQNLPTTFILLRSYSEPTENGESMDVAAGYSTAINVAAGGKITVTNLSDATYLVITTNSNSDDKSPSKILFNLYEEETEEAVTRLKILTVNPGIYEGKDYEIGDDELLHEYRMAISEASADISFVQADTPYVDIAKTKLAKDYVFNMFKHFYNAGDREYNYKSFASYYAIKDVAPVLYTNIEGAYYHYMFMVGTVKIGNKEIHLVNVHFDWRDITIRRQQIAQVIDYLSNFEYAIVAGDMNPSGRVNGDFPGGQISIDNYTVYPEDNQIWENAGFVVANGGILGLYDTDLSKYDADYPADVKNAIWAWDNIYVKGGCIAKSGLIQKEYMNDHAYIWADVVF